MTTTSKPYNIYAEAIDAKALDQFHNAMAQDYVVRGALMPDAHAGYALPIGAVVATEGVVVPAWVGYDIGCGMCAVPTGFVRAEVEKNAQGIFNSIYRGVPVGFSHNQRDTTWEEEQTLARSETTAAIFAKNGLKQLGSLGGGNHFIEIGHDEEERIWIIVHSGSRGIGHTVASHYMKLAAGSDRPREGHDGLEVDSPAGQDYIIDLDFCLNFALENRHEIIRRVVREMQHHCPGEADWEQLINRNHNHAEEKDGLWIHRKGATHAEEGMGGVIPGNMRDGSFIVEGKGHPEALWSSSHGAGRVLSRSAARKSLSLDRFSDCMHGIVARVNTATLDESPLAYKDIFAVMDQQAELVTVRHHVRPLINIKG